MAIRQSFFPRPRNFSEVQKVDPSRPPSQPPCLHGHHTGQKPCCYDWRWKTLHCHQILHSSIFPGRGSTRRAPCHQGLIFSHSFLHCSPRMDWLHSPKPSWRHYWCCIRFWKTFSSPRLSRHPSWRVVCAGPVCWAPAPPLPSVFCTRTIPWCGTLMWYVALWS